MADISLPSLPCYLNGDFMLLSEAKVSVLDRAFIFGDAIYDVVPIHKGRPFRLTQHLQRLSRGLRELRISQPFSDTQWAALITDLMDRASNDSEFSQSEWLVYLQVSRGVGMRDHSMLKGLKPTVFAMIQPFPAIPPELFIEGITCITSEDFRWKRADIKSTSLLGSVMARQLSIDQGADDTILFRDGELTEASASNVWLAKRGTIYGVPKTSLVLEGIRYGLLEEFCAKLKIPYKLQQLSRNDVMNADEVLLTSAVKQVIPVVRIDDKPIGSGKPGPIYAVLRKAYDTEIGDQV